VSTFRHLVEFLALLAIGFIVAGAAGIITEAWRGEK